MRLFALAGLGMAFVLSAADKADVPKADVPKGLEKLQGTWAVTKMEKGAKEDKECVGDTFTVTGDKFTIKTKDGTEKMAGTLKVDTTAKPNTVDMIMKNKEGKEEVMKGICTIDGDILKCCMAMEPGKDRPTEIAAKDNTVVVTLKKVPPIKSEK